MSSQSSKPPGDAKRMDLRKIDFLLKPRFTNMVPDVPFDAKFMACPFVPITRFVDYKETTVEKEFKHPVLCDDDMGLTVDLIDLKKYDEDKVETEYDFKDDILCSDEQMASQIAKRSQQHSRLVPWMRKTEYISTEFNRYGLSADRQETKLGYNLKKNQQVEDMYRDKQSQINAINKTFEDAKKPVQQHYSKKGVYAVSESFFLPDFENWKHSMANIQFDGETVTTALPEELKKIAAEMGIIRGMQAEDMAFAALFVPTEENIMKQQADFAAGVSYDPDEIYDYNLSREYGYKLEDTKQDNDNYAVHFTGNNVYYNKIDSNLKLTRRRKMSMSKKSKLLVTFRPVNDSEMAAMETRFKSLMKPQPKPIPEEDEEDVEEEVEEEEQPVRRRQQSTDSENESDDQGTSRKAPKKRNESPRSESSSPQNSSDDDRRTKKKFQKSRRQRSSDEDEDESDE